MYNIRRNMYIEILLFFLIFIIYSFNVLRTSLNEIDSVVEEYRTLITTTIKED